MKMVLNIIKSGYLTSSFNLAYSGQKGYIAESSAAERSAAKLPDISFWISKMNEISLVFAIEDFKSLMKKHFFFLSWTSSQDNPEFQLLSRYYFTQYRKINEIAKFREWLDSSFAYGLETFYQENPNLAKDKDYVRNKLMAVYELYLKESKGIIKDASFNINNLSERYYKNPEKTVEYIRKVAISLRAKEEEISKKISDPKDFNVPIKKAILFCPLAFKSITLHMIERYHLKFKGLVFFDHTKYNSGDFFNNYLVNWAINYGINNAKKWFDLRTDHESMVKKVSSLFGKSKIVADETLYSRNLPIFRLEKEK